MTRDGTNLRLTAAAVGLASLLLPGAALAQQYINTTIARPWQDISTIPGCTVTNLMFVGGSTPGDDADVLVNIGFTFNFLGQPFTQVRFGSNGFLTFGDNSATALSNVALGTAATPNNFIAPFWDDLVHGSAAGNANSAYTCITGAAPNRVFVIEGGPAIRYLGSGNLEYQIRLYEGAAGRFEYSVNGSITYASASGTVGYEGPGGTPNFSPLTCGAAGTCPDTTVASMVGNVYATFVADAPELTGGFGTTWTRGAFPGQTATGPVQLRNLGLNTATDVTTELYLSLNNTYEATDVLVGTVVFPSVPGGNVLTTRTATLTIPANVPAGDYFLVARVDSTNAYTEVVETDNVVASTFTFATAYDLSPTAAASTNGGNPGDPITVDVTVASRGVPYSGPVDVTVYASLDPIFDAQDQRIARATVNYAGGASQVLSVAGTVPAVTPGAYYAIAVIDDGNAITEYNETNNSVSGAATFPTGPDFTVTTVSVPPQVAVGATFEVATTFGSVAVPYRGPVSYRLLLSANATVEAADPVLGNFVATFNGERSLVVRQTVTMPANAPASAVVIAVIDATTAVAELNEANNTGVSATRILTGFEFRVANVTTTALTEPGGTITVGATIQSVGLPFTGQLPVGVYLSPNELFDPADIQIYVGNLFVAGLSTAPFSQVITLPRASVPVGSYNVIVVVDPANMFPESDETNNWFSSTAQTRVRGAELVVRAFDGPEFGFGGAEYPISVTFANEGEIPARGFQWAVHISENDIIRVTDPRIYLSSSTTIAVGAEVTITATVVLPTLTATATRYLGVFADIFSQIPEIRESNNLRPMGHPVRVLLPVPDLAGELVETPTVAAAGEELAVARVIRNVGVADAASFEYVYYLSGNTTISSDDILVGRFTASVPLAGDDYRIDTLTLPPTVPAGRYYLGMVLDPEGLVDQVTRANDAVVGPQILIYAASIRFVTDTLPPGTLGVRYEAGVYATGGAVGRSWAVAGGTVPPGLTLDPVSGILAGTPTSEGIFTFTVRALSGTEYADREFTVRISSPTIPLTVATRVLAPAISGRPYSAELVAVGGVLPYQWSIVSGTPPGLTATSSGTLSGTPSAAGNYRLVVRVRDAVGTLTTRELALNVVSAGATVLIQQQSLRIATVGVDFCDPDPVTFSATGGLAPYHWSQIGDGVPGLTLAADGSLCGTPERAGEFAIVVRADDQTGLFDTSLIIVEVDSGTELAIDAGELPEAKVGVVYQGELNVLRGEGPYTWSVAQGALPMGLTIDTASGRVSGTPSAAGTTAFTVQVVDAKNRIDIRPLSITVLPADPIVVEPPGDGCGCAVADGRSSSSSEGVLMVVGLIGLGLLRRRRVRGPGVLTSVVAATVVLGSVVASLPAQAQAPVPGTPYQITRRSLTYTPITGTQAIGPDVNTTPQVDLTIPFPFDFYGRQYTTVRVASLGAMTFQATNLPFTNVALGNTAAPNAIIAPFWDDLETSPGNGSVTWTVEGTAPRRVFIVQWNNIDTWNDGIPDANFQVRLHEGFGGRIRIRYGSLGPDVGDAGASMGMEDHTGARPVLFDDSATPCSVTCTLANLRARTNTEIELIQDLGIDLQANAVDAPRIGYVGAQIVVPVNLSNNNGATLGPVTYAIDASRTANMANPVRLFTSSGLTFPPYTEQTLMATFTVPSTLPIGEYYLRVSVDAGATLTEVDESNNTAVSTTRVRFAEGKADLVAEYVTVNSESASAGEPLTVYARIANRGSLPASAASAVMLSSNPTVSRQDLSLSSFNVSLAPGQVTTTTQTITLPAEINSGAYHVGVYLDVDQQVEELSESNNGRAAFRTVAVSGTGLAITTTRLPNAEVGQSYVGQLVATGGSGTYTWSITQGMLPRGLGLVADTGALYGRAATAESQTFTVRATSGSDSVTQQLTLAVVSPEAPLTVVSRSVPTGVVGQEYAFTLVSTGGSRTSTHAWTAVGLPDGLSLSPEGELTGIPTMVGTATVTVTVSDGAAMATRTLLVRVASSGSLLIDTVALPTATYGQPYTAQLSARGGVAPLRWTVELGALPVGVALDVATGVLSGTPNQVGRFRVVIRARDSATAPTSDVNTFELVVEDAGGFVISTPSLPVGYVGEAYDVTIASTGGIAPFEWRVTEGRLPPGIASELRPETGEFRIVGTPTEANVSNILIEVTDGTGRTTSMPFAIDIEASKPVVIEPPPPDEGCSTTGAGGITQLGLLALALGLVAIRRRHA